MAGKVGNWGRACFLPWERLTQDAKGPPGSSEIHSPQPPTRQGRGADPPLRSSLPAPKVRAHPPRGQVLPEAGLGLGALICPTWHLNSVSHWDASHLRLDGIFPKVHVLRPVLCRRGTPWPHPASAGQDAQGQRRRNPLGSCCSFLGVGRGFQ